MIDTSMNLLTSPSLYNQPSAAGRGAGHLDSEQNLAQWFHLLIIAFEI